MHEIVLKPSAEMQLDKLPANVRYRVVERLDLLAEDPPPDSAQKLQGAADLWRIPMGQYRIVYSIEDEELTVHVIRIAHRKDVYRP